MESHEAYLVRRISENEPLEALTAFPRYFEIETVNACQAKCPMCTIADWNRRDGVMKDDLFEKIASEICDHYGQVIRVHLYRDGEPLLDKKLPQRIKRLKAGGVRNVGISTNVDLLDEKRGLAILQAGIDEVILSIDSIYPNVYASIRVGLELHKVLENAKLFIKLRDGLRSKCRIRIRMIEQEANTMEWQTGKYQAEFWRLIGPEDSIERRAYHNWGGAIDGPPADTSKPCIALWSLMCIFADGSVPMCNVDYNNNFPLGNVRDHSIAELWQSHEQNRRRELHLSNNRAAIPPCTNCTVWTERC